MAKKGLGGAIAGGAQYVSWIHDTDFVRALDFLIANDKIAGALNLILLKSRRVVPTQLLDAGFALLHPTWDTAARDLVKRWRMHRT